MTAEYGMLPRSTHTRMDREAARGKQSGRTQEIQRLIGRSLRAAFDLEAFGERTLHLDCDVIQADGGTRTASITGAMVAAYDAFNALVARGVIAGGAGEAFRGRDLGGRVPGHAGARPRLHRRFGLRHRHERGDDRRRPLHRSAGHGRRRGLRPRRHEPPARPGRMPPDSSRGSALPKPARPISSSMASARAFALGRRYTPCASRPSSTFCCTVSQGNSANDWNTIATPDTGPPIGRPR
jgi:hypothetical protein